MPPFNSYIICTSPRSGSTLLCRLLAQTGRAGRPESYFHRSDVESWLASLNLPLTGYTDELTRLSTAFSASKQQGSGETDIFGLRLQRHSFDFWIQQLGKLQPQKRTDLDRIKATFGETLFIHLTRESKLDQAISFVKAQQSGLWHQAPDGTEIERLSDPQEPRYDADAIAQKIEEFTRFEADWRAWFTATGIQYQAVTYDQLCADPHGVVASVLRSLGVANIPKGKEIPVAKLANEINRDWAERYLAENG